MVKGMNEQMANNPEMAQVMQDAMAQQMGNA